MRVVAYFVRHGETALNKDKAFRGRIDVELNDMGRQQAQELAEIFSGTRFSAAFSSLAKRAEETGEIVLSGRDMKIQPIQGFDSYNVGILSGEPKDKKNLELIDRYTQNPEDIIPGGESISQFRIDADPSIKMVINLGDEAGVPTISFVHSSIIHEVSHVLTGDHSKVKVAPGGVVAIFKVNGEYKPEAIFKKSEDQQDSRIGS